MEEQLSWIMMETAGLGWASGGVVTQTPTSTSPIRWASLN